MTRAVDMTSMDASIVFTFEVGWMDYKAWKTICDQVSGCENRSLLIFQFLIGRALVSHIDRFRQHRKESLRVSVRPDQQIRIFR